MPPKRIFLIKVRSLIAFLAVMLLVVVLGKAILAASHFWKDTGITPGFIIRFIFDTGSQLKSADNRTNVLVMGVAGGSHEGADLTDTMLVLSINQRQNNLALISVPRDIWSEALRDKINTAYHYGEEKRRGGGMILARAIVEDIIGMPVQYAIVIDFSGFKKVIDLIGGVTINVSEAFTDAEFPVAGKENDPCGGDPEFHCRYETLHFDVGPQSMNGDRALKYVRSRHAEGSEGGDFARNRRQQDLLIALKGKLTSLGVWLSPGRDKLLFQALDEATDTDMTLGELLTLGKIFESIKPANIAKISFVDLLETPPLWLYDGKYVLVPKDSFAAIHEYIQTQLQ